MRRKEKDMTRKQKRISYNSGMDYKISLDEVSLQGIKDAAKRLNQEFLVVSDVSYIRRAMRFYGEAVQKMTEVELLEERLKVEQARRGV